MVRVLQMFGEPLSNGGQEAFIMNVYRNIDRDKVQFDFFTPYYCEEEWIKNKINELGGNLYVGNNKFKTKKVKKIFTNECKKFLKNNKYDIIHIHSGSLYALTFGARIAKKSGAQRVIVHAHNTGINNFKYKVIKFISKFIITKYATDYFACSHFVAKWKFPKKIVKQGKYKVIKNGIDTEKFSFSKEIREKYREELGINNKFVVGNVGRLSKEKNHIFLIEVFNEIYKKNKNSVLLLIGGGGQDAAGESEKEIREKVKEYGLEEVVYFLGSRKDVNNILQALDVFVFPSLYEGLGIVAIEAQTAGLVTVCSENVPDEANLTDLFKKINISQGVSYWADQILKYNGIERKDRTIEIRNSGYEAIETANTLQRIYEGEK